MQKNIFTLHCKLSTILTNFLTFDKITAPPAYYITLPKGRTRSEYDPRTCVMYHYIYESYI